MNYRVGNVFRFTRIKLRRFLSGDTLVEVMFALGIFSMVAITVVSVMSSGSSNMQTSLETTMARNEIDAQAEALRFIHQAYLAEKDEDIPDEEKYYSNIWNRIVELAHKNALELNTSSYDKTLVDYSPTTCSELYTGTNNISTQNAFIIDTRALGETTNVVYEADSASIGDFFREASIYPRVFYTGADKTLLSSGTSLNAIEGLYIVGLQDNSGTVLSRETQTVEDSAFFDFYIRSCWYGYGKTIPTTISTLIRLYDPNVNIDSNEDTMDYVLTYDWNGLNCSNGGNAIPCPAVQKKVPSKDASYTFTVLSIDQLIQELPDGLSPIQDPIGWTRNESGLCVTSGSSLGLVSTVTLNRGNPMATVKAVSQCQYTMAFTSAGYNGWSAEQRAEWNPKTALGGTNGTNITLPPASMNPPNQLNSAFVGWVCKQTSSSNCEGDTSVHAPGSSIHYGVSGGKPVLYKLFDAQYAGLYNYSLSFNKNTTDSVSNMPTSPMTKNNQTTATYTFAINSTPSRTGYTFVGWNTDRNATTAIATNSYTLSGVLGSTASKTLYAIWQLDTQSFASGTPASDCHMVTLRTRWRAGDLDGILVASKPGTVYVVINANGTVVRSGGTETGNIIAQTSGISTVKDTSNGLEWGVLSVNDHQGQGITWENGGVIGEAIRVPICRGWAYDYVVKKVDDAGTLSRKSTGLSFEFKSLQTNADITMTLTPLRSYAKGETWKPLKITADSKLSRAPLSTGIAECYWDSLTQSSSGCTNYNYKLWYKGTLNTTN